MNTLNDLRQLAQSYLANSSKWKSGVTISEVEERGNFHDWDYVPYERAIQIVKERGPESGLEYFAKYGEWESFSIMRVAAPWITLPDEGIVLDAPLTVGELIEQEMGI